MSKTYVVTGGAGFIGSHLVERLLKDGSEVRVVDNFTTGKLENIARFDGNIKIYDVSVTDKAALDTAFVGADYVYHQAALPSVPRSIQDPLTTHDMNVTGTLNVLIAARDAAVKRVIYAASSSAYGDQEGDAKIETMLPHPLSPYGVSKLAGELYCRAFTASYGLETVCLRYFNVFGPRQDPQSLYAAVIPRFITAILRGEPPIIYGDGEQSRDFTYIDNVVHGNMLAASAPEANGQVINLALGGSIRLNDLVARLNQILGTDIQAVYEAPRTGDIIHSRADISLAEDLLDFAPIVDFDDGLARTAAWYQAHRTD
jgi:nucleoside-diphosphate-sugar epimerase